ncbi:MAG: hypothetical protein A2V45_01425 [Candidatus Aminicenantes bacterium RBG_19FT_COMBO_58_17]|nr:MAG: hypothetical protein A2V45_01425 [Candidatus Aminicenantes bacterium RBG_19FT_COMBO_58_17]HCS49098.1 hypothetical protein [Candidatus Aminicenantes bacterium]
MKTTRREFLKHSAALAGGTVLLGRTGWPHRAPGPTPESRVVSVAASDMLVETKYNPDAVSRAFEAGMKELTGQKTAANAWASLFGPSDVVGIKINCIGAPRISSSLASINATIAGLKSAGVKENNIIIWDRVDREFQKTGLAVNKGPTGVRVMGASSVSEAILPWVEGYDRNVYVSYEDGTLKRFRELVKSGFTKEGTHRDIFNSVTWLWTLCRQGNEKAIKYESEMRRLYMDYEDREGIKRVAEEVADQFNDVTIEDEEKSFLANIVTKDITKLVNIAVLKHNEDSGVTWAAKNIALGVTTNKVRFHIDYCARAIPDILAMPCLRDKMALHIGEAAKISTVSVAGAQIATDNRIFFSRDPVAMDRIGLDILEEKRREQGLESIRSISTHVAACAAKGLGTDDLSRIDLRALKV